MVLFSALHTIAATALPGILQAVAPFLDQYGYLAVGLFLFVEDFGIPVPGETILIASAVYAGTGRMSIPALAIIGVVAAVIGDNIGFAIGHYGGERLVLRYGKYVFLTKERFNSARNFFNRFGGPIIIVARFIDGLRQLNGIIAGSADMKWSHFLSYNIIGACLWVGGWLSIGYFAGNHLATVYHTIVRYEMYFLLVVVVLLAGFVVYKIAKKRRRQNT
jgi:membrane protein DedA with SNARE-associated domain